MSNCKSCGKDVPLRSGPSDGPFAALLAEIPPYCDECVARDEVTSRTLSEAKASEDQAAAIAERVRRSGLPARHHVRVNSLDHPPAIVKAATRWALYGGGLLLTGAFGYGKTYIAGAAAYERLRSRAVTWTSAPLLMARLGTGLGSEQRDWALDVLASRTALVLDDIDKTRPTEYGAEQVFLAVDQRVEHESPLLVTTNLAISELAEKWPEPFGEAIASRLAGYCTVLRVQGSDRRLERFDPLAGLDTPRMLSTGTGQ